MAERRAAPAAGATGILWRDAAGRGELGRVECFAAADAAGQAGYRPGEFIYDDRLTGHLGDCWCDTHREQRTATLPAVPREVPPPARGSGPVHCCGGHRERCLFGRQHSWTCPWYENGEIQRTYETFRCYECGGVCTAEETEQAGERHG